MGVLRESVRVAACFCFLRRQTAREPKKVPAAVNTQIVMVTAISLVVIMLRLPVKQNCTFLTLAQNPPD
jgi:hypothetical protein